MRVSEVLVVSVLVAFALSGCTTGEFEGAIEDETHDEPDITGTPGHGGGSAPAGLTAAFTHSCTGLECSFDATSSRAADAAIVSYHWEFGSDQTGSTRMTNHTFAEAGDHEVTLTVVDAAGLEQSITRIVTAVETQLKADFTYTCEDLTCEFDGSASSAGATPIVQYEWNFGMQAPPRNGVTTQETFQEAGTFEVSLEVTDENDLSDSDTQEVIVSGPPEGCNGPSPPDEQEKENLDEIECPGDFVITHEGLGEAWAGPTWEPGDWWKYEAHGEGIGCEPGDQYEHPWMQESVEGTATAGEPDQEWEVPTFDMKLVSVTCDDEEQETEHAMRTQEHLTLIEDAGPAVGYIDHELLLPLTDGKKWTYMDLDYDLIEVEATYAGESAGYNETWRIIMDIPETTGFAPDEIISMLDQDVGWFVSETYKFESGDTLEILLVDWHGS